QQQEFTNYPKDTTYKFVEMVALNPEDGPRITDFSIWNDSGDYTPQIFQGNKLLIIVQDVRKANAASFAGINSLVSQVEQLPAPQVAPLVLTASSTQDFDVFRHEVNLAVPYYFGDATVLKTMMRANPGIMLLKNGLVVGKWHHNDLPTADTIRELL
ncbi:MAG: DoxX family protein, partial [Adhaeribacter sp.]